jgi:hypothetical protein
LFYRPRPEGGDEKERESVPVRMAGTRKKEKNDPIVQPGIIKVGTKEQTGKTT